MTSVSVQWTIPATQTAAVGTIDGYFIYFRDSLSAGKYDKITIFGNGTHSHVINGLKPGRRYDIKVRAFNVHGSGPFSQVQYQRTQPKEKKRKKVTISAVQSET